MTAEGIQVGRYLIIQFLLNLKKKEKNVFKFFVVNFHIRQWQNYSVDFCIACCHDSPSLCLRTRPFLCILRVSVICLYTLMAYIVILCIFWKDNDSLFFLVFLNFMFDNDYWAVGRSLYFDRKLGRLRMCLWRADAISVTFDFPLFSKVVFVHLARFDEMFQYVDRQREYYSRILLGWNGVERLEVAQL